MMRGRMYKHEESEDTIRGRGRRSIFPCAAGINRRSVSFHQHDACKLDAPSFNSPNHEIFIWPRWCGGTLTMSAFKKSPRFTTAKPGLDLFLLMTACVGVSLIMKSITACAVAFQSYRSSLGLLISTNDFVIAAFWTFFLHSISSTFCHQRPWPLSSLSWVIFFYLIWFLYCTGAGFVY